MCLGLFATLLHDQALQRDGTVDENMLRSLQKLKQRHDAFQAQDYFYASLTDEKNMNLLLANLHLRLGQTKEAHELLDEQFQRGIEILKDEIIWNDSIGYHILSKILFIAGMKRDAEIAQSLRRFESFLKKEPEKAKVKAGDLDDEKKPDDKSDGDDDDARFKMRWSNDNFCSMGLDCATESNSFTGTSLYACMTCVDVSFCESCYKLHTNKSNSEDWNRFHICHSQHKHIKSPLEDWEISDDVMTTGGKKVTVSEWLQRVEREWNSSERI